MRLSPLQTKVVAVILLVSCMNLFIGCNRFYRPVVINTPSVESKTSTLKRLSEEDRYIILRRGAYSYSLTNVILDQQNLTLTANVGTVPRNHQVYLTAIQPKYTYSR